MSEWDNESIAEKLLEFGDLLEQQNANPYRVSAYRRAARVVAAHPEPLTRLARREGAEGLDRLPAIGRSIAHAIEELIQTGRWTQLDRLRGQLAPEELFQSIPGVGPTLAATLHDTLEVETLAALEVAAHDGRLEHVPGIGPRRARMIAAALARMLQRRPMRPGSDAPAPPVDVLLDVDREYRERAARGDLRRIAPRRFNPEGRPWLPILHTQRGDWQFTALFSNTARAHELGRTDDWVVLYYHTDHEPEHQCTVVTETHGRMAGQRVVRGREAERPSPSS
ncbi:MAG: helix-hairpin-helix domain-containing protein [Xanthomonadales bacterium]